MVPVRSGAWLLSLGGPSRAHGMPLPLRHHIHLLVGQIHLSRLRNRNGRRRPVAEPFQHLESPDDLPGGPLEQREELLPQPLQLRLDPEPLHLGAVLAPQLGPP
jgi:hypothetical protein